MPTEIENSQTDKNCLKRLQMVDDEQTSVKITFKLLSRKSKKKLEELLHQWSEWHAQECSLDEDSDEDFESGEETYFPALHVSEDKSCTISVYMDNQVKKKRKTEDVSFSKGSVPIYDRDSSFALMLDDALGNKERDVLSASRCFNCDSYDHALKECPKPFNKIVVNNARKLHQSKSRRPAGPRVLTRYYQDTPGGKFDGLMPGCLDPETRKHLGLGATDPPPWLNRMRELGYPPGYLDSEGEDQPSGIIIYANGDSKEENEECLNVNTTNPKQKMSVDFPGINAPIPVNADRRRWATPDSRPTGFNFNPHINNNNNNNNNPLSHLHNPSWWMDCRHGSNPFRFNYARSYQDYAPGVSLLSNYANEYWDYINQPRPGSYHSYYEYQNSWSPFNG